MRRLSHGVFPTILLCCWLSLSGCASHPPPADTLERISFRPQSPPFCGRCETTSFLVGADGELTVETGYWNGPYRDWQKRRSTRRVTAEQFAAFKQRLAPYRPSRDMLQDPPACTDHVPDLDGAIVEWSADGQRLGRVFDFGCRDDTAIIEAVRDAPSVLGL